MNRFAKITRVISASCRRFMNACAKLASAGGAMAAGALELPASVHAADSNLLRVGLIRCGGRGNR